MPLFDTATSFALRYLPRDKFTALRERYFAFRAALNPVMRAIYGSFDSAALKTHLEQRVGRDFEILMVHSSVNYLRPMYDADPLEFVQMLIEFCGAERTLAMPAFYFGDPDIGGACSVKVDVDVATRVDDRSQAGRLVGDQRREVAETIDDELAQEHRGERTSARVGPSGCPSRFDRHVGRRASNPDPVLDSGEPPGGSAGV